MTTKTSDKELTVQEHCIDLPGETVQCWIGGGTDKLKVILRKHRDVIFDIHLGTGKKCVIETTESDFYNARDKKLVYAAQHGKVTFNDGERMHVWVSRGFRGALVLKCDGHIISEVKPNELDTHHHSDDPKEKPAPIIIAIANVPSTPKPAATTEPANIQIHKDERSLHVHTVSKVGAPSAILSIFENGGESLNLDSENIITRNWIIGQILGIVGYATDNYKWINELKGCKFYLQKVMHRTGPQYYIIFTGNNRLREEMSASRYSLQNSKIMRITGGAGGIKQGWESAKGAAKDSFKVIAKEEGKMVVKGGGITLILTIGMDIAEWYKDYSDIGPDGKPKRDFSDLFAKLGTDLLKTGLIAALTTASVALGFGVLALAGVTVTAPVIAVVIGTILVTTVISLLVEKADKAIGRTLGEADTSSWLAKKFRETAQYLSKVNKDVRYNEYSMISI